MVKSNNTKNMFIAVFFTLMIGCGHTKGVTSVKTYKKNKKMYEYEFVSYDNDIHKKEHRYILKITVPIKEVLNKKKEMLKHREVAK